MSQVLEQLIRLMDLRTIETNVYVGDSQDLGFKRLFGGQVLGQALVAASRTVGEQRHVHSLHGYFLRSGNAAEPVYYEVDLIRSGRSFSTRRVVAKQGGLAIFSMSASFQNFEAGFEHQSAQPTVPGPDGIPSEQELFRRIRDRIPESVRDKLTADRPIEIRVVDPVDIFAPSKRPPLKHSWIRTAGRLPNDPLLHTVMLAYASDFGLATTALLPHGVSVTNPKVQVASLDHAMWFHRPVRMDEWLLYVKDSPWSGGGRGFNRGQIFDQAGALIASVTQECLLRPIDAPGAQDPLQGQTT